MRILFAHNFHQKHGGDDTVVENYVAMLRRRGHEVDLYQRHNDEILQFGALNKAKFLVDTVYSWRTRRELRQRIAGFRPQLVFVHGIYPLISPSIYDEVKAHGIPLVQMMHDMRPWCSNAWFYRKGRVCTLCAKGNFWHGVRYRCYRNSFLLSALYGLSIFLSRVRGYFRKIDLFIIPSQHIRTYLHDSGVSDKRIAFLPHIVAALDPAVESNTPAEAYAAFLGRLSPEKGLGLILHAARQLPHVSFHIAGVGPMETELHEAVKGLTNVEMEGFLGGPSKTRFLEDAALLLVPSECYESFGQVVVEAYMTGTPVLAANHGGLASLVMDGKTGWLFEPANAVQFCNMLQSVVGNAQRLREAGAAARKHYEQHLSEEVLISQLEQSLESVVGR